MTATEALTKQDSAPLTAEQYFSDAKALFHIAITSRENDDLDNHRRYLELSQVAFRNGVDVKVFNTIDLGE